MVVFSKIFLDQCSAQNIDEIDHHIIFIVVFNYKCKSLQFKTNHCIGPHHHTTHCMYVCSLELSFSNISVHLARC